MNQKNRMYFTMFDGEEFDRFEEFLNNNNIKYDCRGTGDVDFDGNAENDIIVFPEDDQTKKMIEEFMGSP